MSLNNKLKITNTLSGEKVDFSKEKHSTIYTCGPTVYSDPHIGNIRPSVVSSLIFSLMKILGNNYIHSYQNITDVDDKIIIEAKKRRITPQDLAKNFSFEFLQVIDKLHLHKFIWKKVTNELTEIEGYIERLKEKGCLVNNVNELSMNVVGEKKEYGKLVPVKSIDVKSNFAVWKKVNKDEYGYESIHGKGRPGWHTECAAIIFGIVGEGQIDVHVSGRDIKFPHNENERFQHKILTGKNLCKCWVHVGNVTLENEKMSKSLGNVVLAKDVLKEYTHSEVRLWLLSTKYSNDIIYSDKVLSIARKQLDGWQRVISNSLLVLRISTKDIKTLIKSVGVYKNVIDYLMDDLATPKAIAFLNSSATSFREMIKNYYTKKHIKETWKPQLLKFIATINFLLDIEDGMANITMKEIERFIDWRRLVEEKEWDRADKTRNYLLVKKVLV